MLVDEPSLGLAPLIIDQVYDLLLDLRRTQGLSLLVVEQSTSRILKHADRIYVVRNGCVQLEDAAANLRQGDAIKRAYFGFADEWRHRMINFLQNVIDAVSLGSLYALAALGIGLFVRHPASGELCPRRFHHRRRLRPGGCRPPTRWPICSSATSIRS